MKVSPTQMLERQSWPLKKKIAWAQHQIRIWYEYWCGKVYVSFSGGKDSTVLLHLVRTLKSRCGGVYHTEDIPAVFCNTGLEFPEIVKHVKATPNVTILRPKMSYKAVLETHGYPVVSKKASRYIWDLRRPEGINPATKNLRLTGMTQAGNFCPGMKLAKKWLFLIDAPFEISDKCCVVMKKDPLDAYVRKTGRRPITGVMAGDSRTRGYQYMKTGCNSFGGHTPMSRPMSIWSDEDVWAYTKQHKVKQSKIYAMGYRRTGCVFCAFGAHMEESPNRFELLKKTHPKLWKHCMDKLGMRAVLKFVGVPTGDS